MRDLALAHYDRMLVHTDPAADPVRADLPLRRRRSATRLLNTGYVVDAPCRPRAARAGERGAGFGRRRTRRRRAAGGGDRGARRCPACADAPWRLIAGGASTRDRFGALDARLPAGVVLERQRRDFQALFAKSLLSVSQAGYNTVVEVLRLGKPMVLVPFETATETEQRIRAERLATWGSPRPFGRAS